MNAHPASHPTDRTLHAYGLGKLDDASAESVNSHLEGCPDCRQRVAMLSSDSFLGRLREAKDRRPESLHPVVSSTDGFSMLGSAPGEAAPPPPGNLPPGLVDHADYEVVRELGQGGMGVVYLAQNTLMGRLEVLKVVGGHLANRRGVLDRFLIEIRNAARLQHPNIVTAYSAIRLGESFALAMEYVDGFDLTRLVKAKGPLPLPNSCNYIHQAALGLQHAHEHGMVHRDIKPGNLMLTRQGTRALIKVLDFGLAKVKSEGAVDGGLTSEGQMLGTPHYIAPEQTIDARRADIRADVYSLGCTFYYLLTGGPPFDGTSLYDILQAHHSREALPLNLARPDVPVEVAAIVAKMMAKEPERRFQEPKEVAQALKPLFKSGNVAVQGQRAEVSRAGQTGPGRPGPGPVSTPAQPATNEGPVIRPKTPVEPTSPQTWRSLIDLAETERPRVETPAVAPSRRPPWFWPSVAVGTLLLGIFVVGGVLLRLKSANGTIEIANLEKGDIVTIDGEKATITRADGGDSTVITTVRGSHKVKVIRGGTEVYSDNVSVGSVGKALLTIRSKPDASPIPPVATPFSTSSPATLDPIALNRVAEAKPSEAKTAVPSAADSLREGTHWKAILIQLDTDNVYVEELTIDKRQGTEFEGVYSEVSGNGAFRLKGTVVDGKISWEMTEPIAGHFRSEDRVSMAGTLLHDRIDVLVNWKLPNGEYRRFKGFFLRDTENGEVYVDVAAKEPKRVAAPANRKDLLAEGTVWYGLSSILAPAGSPRDFPLVIRITKREGDSFEGTYKSGEGIMEMKGTVKESSIEWTVSGPAEFAGATFKGMIEGDRIDFDAKWRTIKGRMAHGMGLFIRGAGTADPWGVSKGSGESEKVPGTLDPQSQKGFREPLNPAPESDRVPGTVAPVPTDKVEAEPNPNPEIPIPKRPAARTRKMTQPPPGPFEPRLGQRDWVVGDETLTTYGREGVIIQAGTIGNYLITRRNDYKRTVLKMTLAASPGTVAFVALRVHQEQGRWLATTSMIFDSDGRIRAGMEHLNFREKEAGDRRKDFAHGEFFEVKYRINEDTTANVAINGETTFGIHHAAHNVSERGAVGVFVKSGTLVIRSLVVED